MPPSSRHVLLRNHRVGAIGQRRAGEDAVRFAGGQRPVGERSRRDAPGQAQPRRIAGHGPVRIVAAERIPVHRRVGPGRNVGARRHVLGEHAMERMRQLDVLGSERGQTGENPLERLFDGDHADILAERRGADAREATRRTPPFERRLRRATWGGSEGVAI